MKQEKGSRRWRPTNRQWLWDIGMAVALMSIAISIYRLVKQYSLYGSLPGIFDEPPEWLSSPSNGPISVIALAALAVVLLILGALMRRNANNDPLRNPDTAFGKLDEEKYRAERDLVERYQAFVAELLRLSLLGIAVFGFLYKIIFEANLLPKLPQAAPTAPKLAAFGVAMFGISALFALSFRFFSIASLGLYIRALRYKECTPSNREGAQKSLNSRHRRNVICTCSKALAAASLAVGGVLEAFAVFLFIW